MLDTRILETISLKEMDTVKLMNRVDNKYCISNNQLQEIIDEVSKDYYILRIDGESALRYSTNYFDTEDNEMFVRHHNGKLTRFKIRKRSYLQSGISFLEIKFKNNKGRTIKRRIDTKNMSGDFDTAEEEFIREFSPYAGKSLQWSLNNEFSRFTLVSKALDERCTIDLNLRFRANNGKEIRLDGLAIVEIKTDGLAKQSPLATALRNKRIQQTGFSKYCVGRTMTDDSLKYNAFKPKIRCIEKLIQKHKWMVGKRELDAKSA